MFEAGGLSRTVQKLPWRPLARWWIAGIAFTAVGAGCLYLLIDVLRMQLLLGTTICCEFTLVLRFLVNDRWVFAQQQPSWVRLGQFHVASAVGAAVWWVITNGLPHFGVNYLIASILATPCSAACNMLSNFFWVWRDRKQTARSPASLSVDPGTER